jgi:hypothetical protein
VGRVPGGHRAHEALHEEVVCAPVTHHGTVPWRLAHNVHRGALVLKTQHSHRVCPDNNRGEHGEQVLWCCCCYCGDSQTKPHIVVNIWHPNSPQSPLPRQQQKKHGGPGAALAIEGVCTLQARNHTLGHPKACKRCAGRAADAWESEQTAPSPFPTISPLVPKIRVLLTHIACETHGPAQSRHSVTRSVSQVAPRLRTPDPLTMDKQTPPSLPDPILYLGIPCALVKLME